MIETEVTFMLDDIIRHDEAWLHNAFHEHLTSQHNVYDVDGIRSEVLGLYHLIDGPALTFLLSGYPINESG